MVRYVSTEALIAESSDDYYAALLASTHGWHEARADPWPWLTYFVGILHTLYAQFADRAGSIPPDSKRRQIREYVLHHAPHDFRFADLRAALPAISDPTIRAALAELRREGAITPDGVGQNARWTRLDG